MNRLAWMIMALCLVVVSCGAFNAHAAGFDTNVIAVKVRSFPCEAGEIDWRGSGFLLRRGGDVFVVTSEHVVLWGNGNICHSISNGVVGRLVADLVAADWGEGLALLKVRGDVPVATILPQLEDFENAPVVGESVVSVGFPWALDTVLSHTGGRVLIAESERHFLPNTQTAIELEGAHGEFGMSGGPLLTADQSHVMGLLSHQYLKMVEGGQTVVSEYQSGELSPANQILAVPGRRIQAWLTRYFADSTGFQSAFVRDSAVQIEGRNVVYTEGLEFESEVIGGDCQSAAMRGEFSPNKSVMRMSGDPVGIGGDVKVFGKPVRVKIRVDHAEGDHLAATRWYLPAKADWISRVKSRLYLNSDVSVSSLLYRSSETQTISQVCVSSLEEFFRKLSSPQANAITNVSGGVQEIDPQMSLVAVRTAAAEASTLAESLAPQATKMLTKILLKRITTITRTLQDPSNWMLIELSDLDEVTDPQNRHREAWGELFSTPVIDNPVRMLSLLRQVKTEMGKIKL